MSQVNPLSLRDLMLTALPLLLAACATSLPPVPPPAPLIPPLPALARQTERPTFSASASSDIEAWLQLLTPPSSPAKPASAVTSR